MSVTIRYKDGEEILGFEYLNPQDFSDLFGLDPRKTIWIKNEETNKTFKLQDTKNFVDGINLYNFLEQNRIF
jgi:hypothetical protein